MDANDGPHPSVPADFDRRTARDGSISLRSVGGEKHRIPKQEGGTERSRRGLREAAGIGDERPIPLTKSEIWHPSLGFC